jgi:carboxypeptidase T
MRVTKYCILVGSLVAATCAVVLNAPLSAWCAGNDPLLWTSFLLQNYDQDLGELLKQGHDVVRMHPAASMVEIIVSRGGFDQLLARGYSGQIIDISQPFRELVYGDPPQAEYYDYDEIAQGLLDIQNQYPGIAKRVDLTTYLDVPETHEGRHIYALKVSDNVADDEDEAAVVFECGHHARELVTHVIGMDICEQLTSLYDFDPMVTKWVDRMEIWIVPCVNPDGLEYVWDYNEWWRKNRRYNGGDEWGVDNNRNYPFGWRVWGNWSSNPGSQVYTGPSPLSEPENKTMVALWEHLVPVVMLDYHSYGDEVLDTYVYFTMAEPLKHDTIRNYLESKLNYGSRSPSSTGEAPEEAYHTYGVVCYLLEVGYDFQPPFWQAQQHVEENRAGWRFMLNLPFVAPGVTGRVTDSTTGDPLVATYEIEEIDFVEGEIRRTEPGHGRYIELLPGNSTYHLTFSADGYAPKTVPVFVGNRIVFRGVQLDPL